MEQFFFYNFNTGPPNVGMSMRSASVADRDICNCSLEAPIVELSEQKMIQPLCDLVVRGLLADTAWFQLPAPLVSQWHSKTLFGFGERQVPTSCVLLRYRVQCIGDQGKFLALDVTQKPQSLMVHFQWCSLRSHEVFQTFLLHGAPMMVLLGAEAHQPHASSKAP